MRRIPTTAARRLAAALTLVTGSLAVAQPAPSTRPVVAQPDAVVAQPDAVERWDAKLAAFDRADAAAPVAPGGVVFVGSSSVEKWTTLGRDLPGVANRGVGGLEICDVIRFVDRLALRYRPRVILFYAGDNDLAARRGANPERVAAEFKVFAAVARHVLPDVRIAFVSLTPSPLRVALLDAYRAANDAVRASIAGDDRLAFIDVATPMLDAATGQPRPELFVGDHLHMTPAGYAIWTPLVRAQLDAWTKP